MLVLGSPVILIVALLIKINLGSPIIFKQERSGYKGNKFTIYKFRTMRDLKDKNGKDLPDNERLTKFGMMLRKLSLDEIPQLINVLKGEMSLIGPRPLLMNYLPYYKIQEKKRFDVKPGVTGWAQINGRNNIGWDDKFSLDVWYVENWSLTLDLKIIFLTIYKIFKREDVVACPTDNMLDSNLDEERAYMINFRFASPKDHNSIAYLLKNSLPPEFIDKFIYGCPGINNYFLDRLCKKNKNYYYFIAETEEEIIGCVEIIKFQSVFFLNFMALLKEYSLKGIESRLLKYAIENSMLHSSLTYLDLELFSSDLETLNLYKSLGFNIVQTVEVWSFDLSPMFKNSSNLLYKEKYPLIFNSQYKRYGFSYFIIDINSMKYNIGVLGESWYRLRSSKQLNDMKLLSTLMNIDNSRKFLVFMENPKYINDSLISYGKREFNLIRLQGNIRDIYSKLIPNN